MSVPLHVQQDKISEEERVRLSPAGLRTCRNIAHLWGLTPEQMAAIIAVDPEVADAEFEATDEQFERLSLALGIYRSSVEIAALGARPLPLIYAELTTLELLQAARRALDDQRQYIIQEGAAFS